MSRHWIERKIALYMVTEGTFLGNDIKTAVQRRARITGGIHPGQEATEPLQTSHGTQGTTA